MMIRKMIVGLALVLTVPASAQVTTGRYRDADGALQKSQGVTLLNADGGAVTGTAGVSQRVVTKTNVSANTSTEVCPATPSGKLIAQEMFAQASGIGVSFNGATLTTATVGTATTSPDFAFSAANGYYAWIVPPTNAITVYGAAQIVVCVQSLRP